MVDKKKQKSRYLAGSIVMSSGWNTSFDVIMIVLKDHTIGVDQDGYVKVFVTGFGVFGVHENYLKRL